MKNSLRINRAPMAKKNFTYSSWHDVTRTLSMTVGSPSAHRRGIMLKHVAFLLLFLFAGFGQMWATEQTITLTYSSFGLTTSYAQKTATVGGFGFTVNQGYKGSGNTIQMNSSKGSGTLYNTSAISGLKSIKVNVSSGNKTYTITTGTSQNPTANSQTGTTGGTYNATAGDTYFQLKVSGASYFSSIEITYEEGATLSSVAVSGTPTKTAYENGNAFDATGLTVTGTYSDSSNKTETTGITWTACKTENGSYVALDNAAVALATNETGIYVKATVSGKTSPAFHVTGLTVTAPLPKITITQSQVTSFTNTYAEYSWTADGVSGKMYAYKNSGMQFNSDKTGYYVYNTDPIPGVIRKITMTQASGTARTWTPYVSTTALTSATGTALTAQSVTTSGTTWDVTGSNSYFYLTVAGGSTVIGSIVITYESTPKHEVAFSVATASAGRGTLVASVGGNAISSGAEVAEGATVTLTPSANTYYQVASVEVLDGNADEVSVTEDAGVYSFTMPTSDVEAEVSFEYIPVTSVTLNKSALELVEGATETLSVTSVLPNTARNTVTWSSTNTDVATVTDEGVVTAVAAGDATIKASSTVSTTVFGSCTVNVSAPSGNAVTIDESDYGNVTGNVSLTDILSGVEVVLTAHPNAGYSVDEWQVDGLPSDPVISNDMLTCTFTMPDNAVSVNVAYVHEEATLKLVELGVENTYDSGNEHFWKESVILPGLTGLGCKDKVFVGWDENANCSSEPAYKEGDEYEIPKVGENKLYAVFATQSGSAGATHKLIISGKGTSQTSYADHSDTDNQGATWSGKYNYANDTHIGLRNNSENDYLGSPVFEGNIISVKADITNGSGKDTRYAYLCSSNETYNPSSGDLGSCTVAPSSTDEELSFTVTGEFNQFYLYASAALQFNNIEVTYAGEVSYSDYTTSCTAQLPILAAPTFSVEAGTYYEGKSVTLNATNEADIYYTLDGSEPTKSSAKFTSAISLSARGTTTIKAIAVKEGFETSEVAEATYTINLPFATVGDLFSYLEENSLTELNDVIVTGVVTEIVTEYSSQHNNVSINIADDFDSNSPQLEGYRTKDATGVTAASIVAVGDKVTLKGNYTYFQSTTHELAADNTIEEYTAKVLSSVTVGGTASKTAYSEEDNQFSFAGLTATANYSNTGYSKDVTNEVTWKANEEETYTVTEGGDVNVTATLSDVPSEPKVVAVSYTTKTVASLRLEYASTYTFVGFDLPKPKVYASYVEDIPEEEVTELLTDDNYDTEDAYNKNEAGNYTIKVGYKSKEATYTVTVKAIYNTQETAHSVADAIEIIKKSTYTSTSADPTAMYVHGVVSQVGSISSGKLGYYINDTESTDGQLQVYQGLYFGSESFTNDNILAVGDEVIIEGHMLYFSSTTPELKLSPLVYLLKKALPTISVEDVDEMEVGQADLDVTELITKQGNGVVSLVSGDSEKLTVDGLTLHAVGAGDVTITANLAATANEGSINYKANSTTFTVRVIAARTRYTVTFDANGADGGSAPEAIANQLEGATVDLPECTYTWAHHGFTGWKVINLSTSAVIEVENNRFTMPAANVTIQAQWEEIATTHIIFNVNGNTETVAAVDVPQTVEYSITQVTDGQNGYEFVGWAESPETEDVEETIATIESYTPEAGEASKTLYAVFKRVDEGAPKTDVLTAADLAATSTGYVEFSDIQKNSNAKYAGKTAKNGTNIQINDANGQCIISTVSGGVVKNVSITWGGSSNTLDVYASNTAYTAIGDLWDNSKRGTKVTSFTASGSYNFSSDYAYVGVRSSKNAIQLASISITWQPKTTYYTTAPSAVYAVSYALGGGAWEGEACEGANVKAGQTFDICESVPVREHYKFNGWTVGGNVVSGTITINAETAITAVWEAKVENNITYNAGTGSGSDAVVGNNEEGAEIVLPSAADKSLSKEGYNFVGWLYNKKLYEAGTTFEMPASAVTFVAQWKKQNITKMTLVTDVAQLVDGSKVVIVSKDPVSNSQTKSSAIAGQMSGNNKFFASVTEGLTFNGDNTISYNAETAIELTLDKVDGGWALRSGDNYLAHVSGQNQVKWQSDIAVWSISFSGNNATIKFSDNYSIQYNASSGSERFSAYSGSQNAVQLYASVTSVTENASISNLGYVEGDVIVVSSGATLTIDEPSAPASITVKENAVVNVSAATEAGTVIVEKGAKLAIEEGGSVTTDEPLVLYTTLGKGTGTNTSGNAPGSSSEIINAERMNATGDVFLEIELTQDDKASAGWYAFSVPFPVDAMNGVYYGDTKLQNEVGYAIMSHYGDLRAKNEYAWKKFRGIMQPGVFYVITVGNTAYKTLRFKKVAGEALVASSSVAVSPFPTQTGNNADGAWNGIGNPNLQISNLATSFSAPMQFYDHKTNSFTSRNHSMNLVVGSAFFIQYDAASTVSIPVGTTSHNGYLAPQRERNADEDAIYEVSLTNMTTGEMEDNLFLTAREDATNEYEIGRDLAKMSMGTAKCAQMWVPAYGTQLCAADFQLVNNKASYPLTITTPAAGDYRIELAEAYEDATIYLTYEGRVIWNLSMSPYEVELQQGQTEGYGLRLVAAPQTPTDIEQSVVSDQSSVQKVIIDEHVYILRGEQLFDVTGKAVKK